MKLDYFNGLLEIPDEWFQTKTNTEIEDYIENWTISNWPKREVVSVNPQMNGDIRVGIKLTEDEWADYLEGTGKWSPSG